MHRRGEAVIEQQETTTASPTRTTATRGLHVSRAESRVPPKLGLLTTSHTRIDDRRPSPSETKAAPIDGAHRSQHQKSVGPKSELAMRLRPQTTAKAELGIDGKEKPATSQKGLPQPWPPRRWRGATPEDGPPRSQPSTTDPNQVEIVERTLAGGPCKGEIAPTK
ncbi:DNA-directed RNA polymerase subunit beta [Striga asiatica]|uniref:DNA-directed RNA polymerase subunit beta n=1 Tax=Striga asiatica TaxID=4170 RepID=A0A5A7PWK4_STRAF|nr:DNA-directed RNA polymerase subunit beta [Striga asiatica]